jgi:hypothetical protein
MPEYIERKALLEDISESVVFTSRANRPSLELRGANKIIDRIKSAPTADVVEVVRCKDCVFWNTKSESLTDEHICRRFSYFGVCDNYTAAYDYCSYGEKKEGAEE